MATPKDQKLALNKCGSKVLQNAPREHSAILPIFIKLPFVVKTFVLSSFEWPLRTGFTVRKSIVLSMPAQLSSGARCLSFSLNLLRNPCVGCATREGSGETASVRRLVLTSLLFYQISTTNLMDWLIIFRHLR